MGYTGEKHGHCKGPKRSLTYRTWRSMIDRCSDKHKSKEFYFDKGVTVCERWLDFENFLQDMGERHEGTSLDRIDNSKGYLKDSCKWSTSSEQAQNRTSSVLNETLVNDIFKLKSNGYSLTKIANELNLKVSTVKNVVYRGDWSNKRSI